MALETNLEKPLRVSKTDQGDWGGLHHMNLRERKGFLKKKWFNERGKKRSIRGSFAKKKRSRGTSGTIDGPWDICTQGLGKRRIKQSEK